jgi:TM2 domain-containing membrane protein YozV
MIDDPKQLRDIQSKAAIMAQSMIFFMEAKLQYEENKKSNEGKALLKKGCSMLADSARDIIATGGIGAVVVVGETLFKNLIQDEGFFNMLFEFIGKKERLEKQSNEFYTFIELAIDKFSRYSDIFGKSILISELVYRYKDRLIERRQPEEPMSFFARARYAKTCKALQTYYDSIADSYNPVSSGSNKQIAKRKTQKQITAKKRSVKNVSYGVSDRSWIVTLLFCLFLGIFGAHRFYAGKNISAVILFLLTFTGIGVIWALIDFINIIRGRFVDADGEFIRS